jgi:mono/diheme cytochrome c family protein
MLARLTTLLPPIVLLFPLLALAGTFELKGDAAKGEATFKSTCASCHGEKGAGDGAAAAALNPKPAAFTDPERMKTVTDESLYKVISEGGPAIGKSPLMVAWKGMLNDQQVRDVAAYVKTLMPAPAPPAPAKAEPKGKGAKAPKK